VDFSGGFPNTLNGVNYGLLRLRIASMRMDWARTSIIEARIMLSFAAIAIHSLRLAVPRRICGNLWGWIPQVRVEHRFDISDGHNVTVQAESWTTWWASLHTQVSIATRKRRAKRAAGLRNPGRVDHNLFGRAMTLGAAGYYSVRTGALTITWMVGRV